MLTISATPVLVVDAHPIYRAGIRDVLTESGRYIVVGEASHVVEAMRLIRTTKPALVIAATNLVGLSGLDLAQLVAAHQLPPRLVLLSDTPDESITDPAARERIAAIAARVISEDALLQLLDRVVGGEPVPTPVVPDGPQRDGHLNGGTEDGVLSLTEAAVLDGLAHGLTAEEIASALATPPPVVTRHHRDALRKLQHHDSV